MPSPPTKTLYLVGFMGTGKSTVGTLLAARWGWPFVDLDERIEQQTGSTIEELFANVGEAGFRAEEARALKTVSGEGLKVVAVGGGAVIHAGNLTLMRSTGVVVCLRATPETILARVGDAATRPLLAQVSPNDRRGEIERLLAARAGYYQQAHHTVDTDGVAPSHVANQIEAELCH
jgi:shikimate kinase